MVEPFDFEHHHDEDPDWDVPEYLMNMYSFWTALGNIGEQLQYAHWAVEKAAEGYDKKPSDNVIGAFLHSPSDVEEEYKQSKGEDPITPHNLLVTAQAALKMLIEAIAYRLEGMEGLPPWWKDSDDPVTDRPLMGFEIEMLRQLLEEDEDDDELG